MEQYQDDANELWNEALEEDSAPAFELNTFEQFVEFIKVGVSSLLEHKKLENLDDIADKHGELIADIGLFLSRYGSYDKWKDERKSLKSELAQTINQLKKLSIEYKSTYDIKTAVEKRSMELEQRQAEIEIRKNEAEKNNQKLLAEIEKLNQRITDQKNKLFEMSQEDCPTAETVSDEKLNELRNAKIRYEIELLNQQAELELLHLELGSIDNQRMKLGEKLKDYREFLHSVDEFEKLYADAKKIYDEVDKNRLYLETKKQKEKEKIEEIDAEIDSKRGSERKIKDEVRKFDIEIEKINVEKAELQAQYDSNASEIDKNRSKIDEIFVEKSNIDEVVAARQKKSKELENGLTQIQNLLRLKISEATQLQSRIDDKLTTEKQIASISETLQEVRSQIEQVKAQIAEKEEEKSAVDENLAELTKNHNTYETRISETRRKIENASSEMLQVQDKIRKFDGKINEIELEKKTIFAENQDALDEIEAMNARKEQVKNKILEIEKEIEEASFAVSEKNNELIEVKAQRNEYIEKKFAYENLILGIEKLLPKNDEQAEQPLHFGADWEENTKVDSRAFEFQNQFVKYKELANLRLELANIIPSKLELEFRQHEIDETLMQIDLESTKTHEEIHKIEEESEQKNNSLDAEVGVIKEKIRDLTDEISSNNANKIEMLEKKEKLNAALTSQSGDDASADEGEILLKKTEISELEKDIANMDEQIERLENFKSEMQEKLDDKVLEKNAYNSKSDVLKKRLEKMDAAKQTLESELSDLKPKISEVSKNFKQTKSKIDEINQEYYSLTTEYERLVHQLRNQDDEISACDAEIAKFEKDMRKLADEKDEIRKLKDAAIEEEIKITEDLQIIKYRVDVTDEDITEVKKKLEETEIQKENLENQLREVLQKMQDTERFISQNKDRKTKIDAGRENIENRVKSLETQMSTKQNLLNVMRQYNDKTLEKIDKLKSEKSYLEVQIDVSNQQRKEMRELNDQLLDKIKQLKDKYDKLYDEYMNRDTVAKDLKVKYPIIEQELEKSRNTEKEAVTKLMRVEEQYSRSSDKTRALELMKTALTKDINQLKHELDTARLDRSNIEAENEQVRAQFDKQQQIIDDLEKKLDTYREMEKKFEAMKKRNDYLEAEMKKFSSLMGFEEIDITSELKKQLISNATLNLSARFLQRGWDYKNTLPSPDEVQTMTDISNALNLLSKPLDAMKLRVNLRKFFESIKEAIPEKLETYRNYFEKRNDEKPLSNTELKDVYSIAAYYDTLKEVLSELMKNLKISVP